MIPLLTVVTGALLFYAIGLRFLWRQQRNGTSSQARKFIFETSATYAKAAGQRAQENASLLQGVTVEPLGFAGEIIPTPGLLLCPLSNLVPSFRKGAVLAWCAQSTQGDTLLFVGENGILPFLVSAFEPEYVLITAVGEGLSASESTHTQQYTPTLAEAWSLHEATITAWASSGYAASLEARHIWTLAESRLDPFFQPAPANAFQREHYFQKCTFIVVGGIFSFGLGVALALWI